MKEKLSINPDNKRSLGQYFTIQNPFLTIPFLKWVKEIAPVVLDTTILEPFAGANNIPAMILQDNILLNEWDCFDVFPSEINRCPGFEIKKRDTITDFPQGYKICITNPPYLSKNSATRRGLPYPDTTFDDIYKLCLKIMLDNVDYVAAIIPETFITSGLFTERLKYVISLTSKIFNDTECPVCLALFNPETSEDFEIYRLNERLGTYLELSKGKIVPLINVEWKMNVKDGNIGIICIDNTKEPSIRFCNGEEISPSVIKVSSRAKTRVSGLPPDIDLFVFINKCNEILEEYRIKTEDIFMASFKGLRSDNKYRRRLDFATAKQIMSKTVEILGDLNAEQTN